MSKKSRTMWKESKINLRALWNLTATELRYQRGAVLKTLAAALLVFLALGALAPSDDAGGEVEAFLLVAASGLLLVLTSRLGIGVSQRERRLRLQMLLPVTLGTLATSRVILGLFASLAVLAIQAPIWFLMTARGVEVDTRYHLTMNLVFFCLLQFFYCAFELCERLPRRLTPVMMVVLFILYFVLIRRVGDQKYLVSGSEFNALNNPIFLTAILFALAALHWALFVHRRGLEDEQSPIKY